MKDIDYNIHHCQKFLSNFSKEEKIDVILLPETAFSGYMFKDKDDVEPMLEECGKGAVFKFCSDLAEKKEAYVMCGYCEKFVDSDNNRHNYNSLYVIDRQGNLLLNYRKRQLYKIDHRWAEEGPSFQTIELINHQGQKFKAAVAICMDLDSLEPYENKDPSIYELGTFCRNENVDVVFLSTAWDENEGECITLSEVLRRWIVRLTPLINTEENKFNKNVAFVAANRVGEEDGVRFVGGSCVIKFNPMERVAALDKVSEGLLISEFSLARE